MLRAVNVQQKPKMNFKPFESLLFTFDLFNSSLWYKKTSCSFLVVCSNESVSGTTGFQFTLTQEWAVSGPRATCDPPQRFQWPAEAFRKNHQVWNFLQITTADVSVEANLHQNLLLFLLEQRFSIW